MRNRKGNSAKGREGGWKRRKEVEEEDRSRGLDGKEMPREGDDEEDGGSKNDDGVRVGQREEGDGSLQEKRTRALGVRCEERETSRPSLGRKPVVLRETSSLATTYFSSLGSGASLEREEERAL